MSSGPGRRGRVPAALSLGFFLMLCAAAAAGGALFPPGEWYASLEKPPGTPPDFVFPIAWTILYAAIAVAGWLLWRARGLSLALGLWGLQLALNAAWSWIFFGLQRPELAFFEIRLLWFAIAATAVLAWSVDRRASYLLAPYLVWVTYASWLNFELWQRNA